MSKKIKNNLSAAAPNKLSAGLSGFIQKAAAFACGGGVLFCALAFSTRTFDTGTIKTTLFVIFCALIFALWGAFKTVCAAPFDKRKTLALLPLIAWCGWLVISFLLNPLKMVCAPSFILSFCCAFLPFIIATFFNKENIYIVNKFILITAALVFIYGLVQIVDVFFLPGLDVLPWRAFFGKRVFSTLANPNLFGSFAMLSLFIIFANWLISFNKKLLLLFVAGLLNLFFTQSKGAWVGFSAGCLVFAGLFITFFAAGLSKKTKRIIALCALVIILAASAAVAVFSAKRMDSVSFRLTTWQGVADMIADAPLTGHGSGSFAAVYTKYRKPEVFYMEGHNVTTFNAENEFLEVLATNGVIGLLLFLWVIFFVFTLAFKKLRVQAGALQAQRAPPQMFLLLGYITAFCAILMHNLFDVSMRFASTMFLFAVITGSVLVLCGFETNAAGKEIKAKKAWFAAFKICAGVLLGAGFICGFIIFAAIVGAPYVNAGLSRTMLMVLSWLSALLFAAFVLYVYGRIIKNTKSVWPIIFILLSLIPFYYSLLYTRADYYKNAGAFYETNKQWAPALENYVKAQKDSPFKSFGHHFVAGMAVNRWYNYKTYEPKAGDINNISRTDFERALSAYENAYKYWPDETQLHLHWGELYYKRGYELYYAAMRNTHQKQQLYSQALEMFDNAAREFDYAILRDPVFHKPYLYMANIEYMKGNHAAAAQWLQKYISGPEGVTKKKYLQTHKENQEINSFLQKIQKYL